MKVLLALTLLVAVAGAAVANDYGWSGCTIAVFFDQDWTLTNLDVAMAPVTMYLVLLNPDGGDPVGYGAVEGGLRLPANLLFQSEVVAAGGGNDGTLGNFFYWWPTYLPVSPIGTLVSTITAFSLSDVPGVIELGPGNPATLGGSPVLIDHTGTLRIAAGWATGYAPPEDPSGIDIHDPDPWFRPIATINDEGVVATEERTLSGVKSLFR